MAKVVGPGVVDMVQLAAKLRAADPAIKRELRKQLTEAAKPIVRDMRESIMAMDATTEAGLREEIANTIRSQVAIRRNGVTVQIIAYGTRMPEGKQNLVGATDNPRGWGHPVFADRSKPRSQWRWVNQVGKPQWFERAAVKSYNDVRNAVQHAMDLIAQALTR